MTYGKPLRVDCYTAQRRAKAPAWKGEQGLCILVHIYITLLAWSLAIATKGVEDDDTVASTFTFIQSSGGWIPIVVNGRWNFCELPWVMRGSSRVLSRILKLDVWMFGCFPLCRELFLRQQISSMTKAMVKVMNHC